MPAHTKITKKAYDEYIASIPKDAPDWMTQNKAVARHFDINPAYLSKLINKVWVIKKKASLIVEAEQFVEKHNNSVSFNEKLEKIKSIMQEVMKLKTEGKLEEEKTKVIILEYIQKAIPELKKENATEDGLAKLFIACKRL